MDEHTMDRLLSGDLSRLPSLPKRVVRLFISSTFTDMTLERNSLMERVYPRLKKYCRERHRLDFQVVDMRWGVRDEATDDHQTVSLCSREIRNCQRVSLGPNFIALVGDKYGFRPLLNRIKSTEYRLLRRCLIESDINTDFLDTWYKEDLNAVPAEYVLQPISSILKNFTNKNEPELQMVDQRIWQAIQERLHGLLLIGSSRLVKQGRMSEREQLLKYSISVTEREVLEGCLDAGSAKSHCLVYVRSIVDLREHLARCLDELARLNGNSNTLNASDNPAGGAGVDQRKDSVSRKASLKIGEDTISLTTSGAQTASERKIERARRLIGRYIDLTARDGVWQVDEEAQAALRELKDIKLASRLPRGGRNLSAFQVHWNEQEGIGAASEEHKGYLNALTDHFYSNLARMIRGAVKSERSKTASAAGQLVGEVLQHSHYAQQAAASFLGRADELDQVRAYLLTGQHQHVQLSRRSAPAVGASGVGAVLPMFLFGVSGCGKTSLMARVAGSAHQWLEQVRRRRHSSVISLHQQQQPSESQQVANLHWDRKPCIVMRFCCTTPASSSMVGMLTSVCRQLQYNFYQFGPLNGLADQQRLQQQQQRQQRPIGGHQDQLAFQPIPEDFVRLVYTFRQLIENCRHQLHRRRTFVILLDSIERLSAPAESSAEAKYSWLTSITRLPPNVRLIVSCSSTGTVGAQLDYLHLKRHFLRAHHRALCRLGANLTWHSHANNGAKTSGSNSNASDSESLDFNSGSSDSSTSDADGDSHSCEEAQQLHGAGQSSLDAADQSPRYGRLLKRLVLPAIRLKRGSRADTREPGRALVSFAPPPVTASRSSEGHESDFRFGARDAASDGGHGGARGATYLGLLHVRPLGKELAVSVLRRWLAESERNLTQQQWAIVERSFAHCSRPIFVKLALGEVLNWKSYSTQGDTKGLTFGSAWLAENELAAEGDLADEPECCAELLRLVRLAEAGQREEREARFKWQMLAMEQQWLNYLDYTARLEQQAAAATTNGASGHGTAKDERGNLVIRIGGAGNVTTGSACSGAGSGLGDLTRPAASGGASAASGPSSMSICHLSDTIEEAICQLFARIELQHGYLLTKHSLAYITAARNGICENELEDILSLDDVVLDDVFQYHLPPVRRIPPLLWTRIRNDLPDYLSERDADGIVITWHHNQFKTVTERRYLNEPKQRVYIHSLMADYFLGRWADKAKPFRCTRQQVQLAAEQLEASVQQAGQRDSCATGQQRASGLTGSRQAGGRLGSGSARQAGASFSVRNRLRSSDQHDQRLLWTQAKAHRRVPRQPLFYHADDGGGGGANNTKDQQGGELSVAMGELQAASSSKRALRYNLRKLTELPHHLLCAGRFSELASSVLFNFHWLLAAIDALGLQSLFADFEATLECLGAKLAECEHDELGEQQPPTPTPPPLAPVELQTNDCVPSDQLEAGALRKMIEQMGLLARTLRLSASALHASPQMLAPQLIGRLVALVERPSAGPEPPSLLAQLLGQCDRHGADHCALLPTDQCLQSPDGLQLSSLEGHPFGVTAMVLTSDQRHLLAVSSKFIMWNIATGEVAREIDPKLGGSIMRALLMGLNNQLAVAYTSNNVLLLLDILTQRVVRCELSAHAPNRQPIRGLKLVDQFGARRFLVWTATSWLVFQLEDSDELFDATHRPQSRAFRGQSDATPSSDDEIRVRLEYELELQCHFPELAGVSLLDVYLSPLDDNLDLVHCTLADPKAAELVRLVTIRVAWRGGSAAATTAKEFGSVTMWRRELACAALAISPSGEQVFCADRDGRLALRRRRATCWSAPKLLRDYSGPSDAKELPNYTVETSRVPLAIEIDDLDRELEASQLRAQQLSERELCQLANFEREIDRSEAMSANEEAAPGDEINPPRVFHQPEVEAAASAASSQGGALEGASRTVCTPGVRFLKLYWPSCVTLLRLDRRWSAKLGDNERRLLLPRDVRNVRVELNQCQLTSALVAADDEQHLLVVASNKRLLVYSVERETLLRSIEAHAGRISGLLPTIGGRNVGPGGSSSGCQLGVASCSLDKSVKIWNLANIHKQSQPIHRLPGAGGQIELLCVCTQRPLAACLTRGGQLSLWDWRTMRLLCLYESGAALEPRNQARACEQVAPIVRCKFSPNGRLLVVATHCAILALALDQPPATQRLASRLSPSTSEPIESVKLTLVAKCRLPSSANQVVGFRFIAQESRLLTIVRRFSSQGADCARTSASATSSSATTAAASTSAASTDKEADEEAELKLTDEISIYSHLLSDLRAQFEITCQVPKCKATVGDAAAAHHHQVDRFEWKRRRLVALTRDQQFLVVVGEAPSSSGCGGSAPRRASTLTRTPLVLNVHSVRDGSLVKTIDLTRLQTAERQGGKWTGMGDDTHRTAASDLLQVHQVAIGRRQQGRMSAGRKQTEELVSVTSDQFNRLKAFAHRDRQTLVALIDDERGSSFIVDVATRRLVGVASNWSGQLSSDGRHGLSRTHGATVAVGARPTPLPSTGGSGGGGLELNSGDLRLLDMRQCRPVKTLVSSARLNELMSATGAVQATDAGGVGEHVLCGFTRPNDAYVYYCDSRLKRLLLMRLSDAQMIANYRLAQPISQIKCTSDGFALVLAQADGSLLSLAVADAQSSDTLSRLAQYPSRRRLATSMATAYDPSRKLAS